MRKFVCASQKNRTLQINFVQPILFPRSPSFVPIFLHNLGTPWHPRKMENQWNFWENSKFVQFANFFYFGWEKLRKWVKAQTLCLKLNYLMKHQLRSEIYTLTDLLAYLCIYLFTTVYTKSCRGILKWLSFKGCVPNPQIVPIERK